MLANILFKQQQTKQQYIINECKYCFATDSRIFLQRYHLQSTDKLLKVNDIFFYQILFSINSSVQNKWGLYFAVFITTFILLWHTPPSLLVMRRELKTNNAYLFT